MSSLQAPEYSTFELMSITSRNKSSDLEAIEAYYLDDRGQVILTDHQERVRRRLLVAHSLLLEAASRKDIKSKLMKRYSISAEQAYRDIRHAIRLFGHVQKSEKEGLRHITLELAMETFRFARQEKDIKQMNAAIANIIKLGGLDREDPNAPDWEKLKAGLYPIVLDEPVRALFQQFIQQNGVLDLTKLMQNVADQSEDAVLEIPGRIDQGGDTESS